MSIFPAEYQILTFACPFCRQEISSEAKSCKFCATPLSENIRKYAIERKIVNEIEEKIHEHKKNMLIGIGLLAVAGVFIVPPISANVCPPVFFVIIGLTTIVKGFLSYREEKRKLKNV